MNTEISTGHKVRRRDGELATAEECTMVKVHGGRIQTHTLNSTEWEVWFVPDNELFPTVCIASSTNPPDRHYDE